MNRRVFLLGCVGRVVFNFFFRCHLRINIKLFSDIYCNRKKLVIFVKSWHVAVNVFSGIPMVYITLWR
jgi:hypothetical protein